MSWITNKGEFKMKKKYKEKWPSQKGSALLLTVILMLTMFVLIGAVTNIAVMQYDISSVQKNTSNTYELAEAGAEQMLAAMNHYLENIPEEILNKLNGEGKFKEAAFLPSTATDNSLSELTDKVLYKKGTNDYDGVFLLKDDIPQLGYIIENYYKALKTNYYKEDKPKQIKQVFKGDRRRAATQTEVVTQVYFSNAPNDWPELPKSYKQENLLTPEDVKILGKAYAGMTLTKQETEKFDKAKKKDFCIIVSEAKTKEGIMTSDSQKVIAPVTLENIEKAYYEIPDGYNWTDGPPEILNSALICFSDVLVTNGGKLKVESGDVSIKGSRKVTSQLEKDTYQFAEPDQTGGMVVTDGGKVVVGGSIYTLSNVIATCGWHSRKILGGSSIQVEKDGDIIAETVAIQDNYYIGGPNGGLADIGEDNEIEVKGNIFVENDVRIDEYIKDASIKVGVDKVHKNGMIFGISDQDFPEGSAEKPDPNKSSGVFNRGKEGTVIDAKGAYVLGQPFVNFQAGNPYYRLRESIGAPYMDDLAKYISDKPYELKPEYIEENKKDIKKTKIKLRDESCMYALEYIAANDELYPKFTEPDQEIVKNMMYQGWERSGTIKDRVKLLIDPEGAIEQDKALYQLDYITKEYENTSPEGHYYNGLPSQRNKKGLYHKRFNEPPTGAAAKYQGIQAYMTAMRSVFYKGFNGTRLEETVFSDVIDLSKLSTTEGSWTEENPLCVTEAEVVDLGDYKSTSGKSIVICKNENVKLKQKGLGEFKGIVICTGNVTIEGSVEIEGNLIVGGDLHDLQTDPTKDPVREELLTNEKAGLKIGAGASLTIDYTPNRTFDITFQDKALLREVLAVFKLADFTVTGMEAQKIFDLSTKVPAYVIPKVVFKEDVLPQLRHSGVNMRITSMKSVKP